MTGRGATTRCCALAAGMCVLSVGPAWGLTREEALSTAQSYISVYYEVTAENAYPAVSCYVPTADSLYLAKLPPGSWWGLPYSYREGEPFTPVEIVTHLYDDHRGAGSSQALAEHDYSCVRD